MTDPSLIDAMTTVTDVKILVLVIFICIGLVVLMFVTALPLLTRKAAAEMTKEPNGQAAECALVTGLRNTIRWQAEQLAAWQRHAQERDAENEQQREQLAAAEAKLQAILDYHNSEKPKNTGWMEWYETVVKLAGQAQKGGDDD